MGTSHTPRCGPRDRDDLDLHSRHPLGRLHRNFQDHRVTSPLFSPDVLHWLDITNHPGWLNGAMLILWIPFGFRGTCYYMRRVYYRSFFQSPTACWVDEPQLNTRIGYTFEKGPFIINNLHRYFLYRRWQCCW